MVDIERHYHSFDSRGRCDECDGRLKDALIRNLVYALGASVQHEADAYELRRAVDALLEDWPR